MSVEDSETPRVVRLPDGRTMLIVRQEAGTDDPAWFEGYILGEEAEG